MNDYQSLSQSKIDGHREDSNIVFLFGKHPVFNAISSGRRKIFSILATQNSLPELKNFLKHSSLARLESIIQITDNNKIESLLGRGQIHQGLVVKCSTLAIGSQDDLFAELNSTNHDTLPPLLILDQISDPHNIGAIIRSASAFNVKKIIFSKHHSPRENATIAKASAGTIDSVDMIVVTNLSTLMEKLKKIGYWCVGLDSSGTASLQQIKDYKNIALIVGSEGDGIRDLVKKNCDLLAKISINKEVESLNASVATAIALYELNK